MTFIIKMCHNGLFKANKRTIYRQELLFQSKLVRLLHIHFYAIEFVSTNLGF